MFDIIEALDATDLRVEDSIAVKAKNLLQVQLGALTYATEFGVDLKYFLDSSFQFQNASFKSYLIQRMLQNRINVADVLTVVEKFFETFSWQVGEIVDSPKGYFK
jgi:hypothetical protein